MEKSMHEEPISKSMMLRHNNSGGGASAQSAPMPIIYDTGLGDIGHLIHLLTKTYEYVCFYP